MGLFLWCRTARSCQTRTWQTQMVFIDTVTNICKTTIITHLCRRNLPNKDVLASIYRNKLQESLDASKVWAFSLTFKIFRWNKTVWKYLNSSDPKVLLRAPACYKSDKLRNVNCQNLLKEAHQLAYMWGSPWKPSDVSSATLLISTLSSTKEHRCQMCRL